MTDQDFLWAILAAPEDDAPRLIYADWLDEQGQSERAEFIRVQCALAQLGPPHHVVKEPVGMHKEGDGYFVTANYDMPPPGSRVDITPYLGAGRKGKTLYGLRVVKIIDDGYNVSLKKDEYSLPWRGTELRRRECELLANMLPKARLLPLDLSGDWKRGCFGVGLTAGYCHPDHPIYKLFPPDGGAEIANVTFRRGFVSHVACTGADWQKHGPAIVACQPIETARITSICAILREYGGGYETWTVHRDTFTPEMWRAIVQVRSEDYHFIEHPEPSGVEAIISGGMIRWARKQAAQQRLVPEAVARAWKLTAATEKFKFTREV